MNNPTDQVAKPSILAPDLEVIGNITSTGDLVVEAKVMGNIAANAITLHQEGSVNGDIEARQITINGIVNGNIIAGNVDITESGKISGSLYYGSLAVNTGATIDGELKKVFPVFPPQEWIMLGFTW